MPLAGFRPLRAAALIPLALAAQAAPLAAPARADDFTAAQRQEIVQIMRQALKSDPSILADAIAALRAKSEDDETAGQQAALAAGRGRLENTPGDAVIGNPHGRTTLYEFYDPRCPWCRRMVGDVETLAKAHPDLRIVLKLVAILGPASTLDGRAILAAANQNAYAALQRALMTDSAEPSAARIRQLAIGLHLDADRLAADMDSPAVTAALEAQRALASSLRITGTPTFIQGSRIAPGAMSYADLEKFIAG